MAGSRIKGITIEIDGNTQKLQKSLSGVNKDLKTTQDNLKDINKLLKLDPTNTELLKQKQRNLKTAISETKEKLTQLKDAQDKVKEGSSDWDAIEREIIDTEQSLKSLEKEYRSFGSVASQQLQAVGSKLQSVGGKISAVGEKLAGASGIAAGFGAALVKLGYDAVTGADDLNTLSKQTGISTDELQKMKYASDLVDVSVEDITSALRKMKSNMKDGNAAFEKLGVSIRGSNGELRSAQDVFYSVISALGEVENETERDQLAMQIFGKSADELAGIIDDGGAALKAYGKEAEEMGLILDGDTLDALNKTNDTIDKVKATTTATMAQVGADVATVLAPVVEKVAEGIATVTAKLRELTPEQTETILKVLGIIAVVAPVLIIIGQLVSSIGAIISAIGVVVGFLGGPLTLAILAMIAIGVLLWKNWDKIKEKFHEVVAAVKKKAEELKEAIKQKFEDIKNGVKQKIDNLKADMQSKWNSIKSDTVNKVVGMKNDVINKIVEMKNSAVEKLNAIKEKFTEKFDSIKEKVRGIIDDIKGFFENLKLKIPKPELPALPHFSIQWSSKTILGKEFSYPSGLNVDWYAKAMNMPYLFTRPTVFGAGEAGDEMMYGRGNLMRDITQATAANNEQMADIMYQAMKAALQAVDWRVVIGNREFGRILREQGAI